MRANVGCVEMLSIAQVDKFEPQPRPALVRPRSSPLIKSGTKILIVDNDEDVLIALERVLEDEGYATATAHCLGEASRLLSCSACAGLVLDDYLSEVDSIVALTELRRLGVTPPAVVVTYHKYPPTSLQARLRLLGVGAVVNKRAYSRLAVSIRELLERGPTERTRALGEWA
ncbi:MAG TPA: response regulator [Terriglobales bacterium]|nr:response regulator [Terriglobales bacterium]